MFCPGGSTLGSLFEALIQLSPLMFTKCRAAVGCLVFRPSPWPTHHRVDRLDCRDGHRPRWSTYPPLSMSTRVRATVFGLTNLAEACAVCLASPHTFSQLNTFADLRWLFSCPTSLYLLVPLCADWCHHEVCLFVNDWSLHRLFVRVATRFFWG